MSTTATTTEAHVATVTDIYEAFGRGDIPAILDRLDPDVAWDVVDPPFSAQEAGVPWLTPRRGRSDVPEFFAALDRELVFHDFQVRNIVGSGDSVLAEIVLDVESKRTGARVVTDEVHAWTFGGDGLITAYRHYVDSARHIEVAGVGPQANAATVAELYGMFGAGDIAGILARVSPDMTWGVYPVEHHGQRAGLAFLQPRRGRAEVGEFFRVIAETIEITRFEPRTIAGAGDTVLVNLLIEGTVRATGRSVADDAVHVWTFDEAGTPTSFREILDTAKQLEAYGLA